MTERSAAASSLASSISAVTMWSHSLTTLTAFEQEGVCFQRFVDGAVFSSQFDGLGDGCQGFCDQ
eukprot:11038888-Ditylum_brightwellii.AAC.1